MIKTIVQLLITRLIPGWLLGCIAIIYTFSLFIPLHSQMLSQSWSWLFGEQPVEAPTYRSSGTEWPDADVVIRWDESRFSIAQPYIANLLVADYTPAWLAKAKIQPELTGLQYRPVSDESIWQPAHNGYKQLIIHGGGRSYIDLAALQSDSNAEVSLEQVTVGYRTLKLDIFGGLFLVESQISEPQWVDDGQNADFDVNQDNERSRLLVSEIWMLNNQLFAVSNSIALAIAALMVCLPWISRRWFSNGWYFFGFYLLLNGVLYAGLLYRFQWLYPPVVPLISLLVAWLWFAPVLSFNRKYNQLEDRYQQAAKQWVDHLLDDGKSEAALRYLQENELKNESFIPQWLQVSRGFERNRQYPKAIECLKDVLKIDASHTAAKEKLKSLTSVVDGTKTLALFQSTLELPVGQVSDLMLGRYQLIKELGRGAMGIVYEAEDPKINRHVALKVVHLKNLGFEEVDQVKQRFFREAQAAGKLNHPNIVTVYDVGEEHDVAYIAMDLLVGEALSDLLSERPINVPKMVLWIAQAADALAYAHENEVIHRDVKPANMIVETRSGQLKLTDFGVARIAGVQQTQTGIVLGSPSYMSPEQILGEQLTGATDVFSLGVTLYQCVSGKLPFSGDTLPSLAYAITRSRQESPRSLNPEVPVSLVRIVNKALQKKPDERYSSARELADVLKKWVLDH
ncbi:MAG: serine/threonine-protein kinase [Reinekea sp.]